MKSLYAYFGLLDLHDIDSPGHSLYQIGLVDSLRESFSEEKFDFYSYYPAEVIKSADVKGFPDTDLGRIFHRYRKELFDLPIHRIEEVLELISQRAYSKLYLKARFRNLSTLSKKWKDARDFEKIIECAVNSGYSKQEIIILDTDLSLSANFIDRMVDVATFLIPSIDFPGISNSFLIDCVNLNKNREISADLTSVFYGNIDTSKYKSGNNKSEILYDVLKWLNCSSDMNNVSLICKKNDADQYTNFLHVDRKDRSAIWNTLSTSTIMLNVTKEKYNDRKFIPARIYEAMIFGMIPVSYQFNFLCPAFSFSSIDDLYEIYAYLSECDEAGIRQAYLHFIDCYIDSLKN